MDYLDVFREKRKELGLRQCDISAALGFKKSTQGMYETRKNKMMWKPLLRSAVC